MVVLMLSSVKAWCETVSKGLAEERKRTQKQIAEWRAAGIEEDEIMRRVYMPWKTLDEYRKTIVEYERLYRLSVPKYEPWP